MTDYLDGFQYVNQALNFFSHAEGFVDVKETNAEGYKYFYVYNYTDHLGNIRVSYGFDPDTTTIKTLEENHYYPFGLKHTNYNTYKRRFTKEDPPTDAPPTSIPSLVGFSIRQIVSVDLITYKYKYNGKEFQDELGLNMYDYGWRNYMPDIGRWSQIDPLFNDLKFANDNSQVDEDDQQEVYMAIINDLELGGAIYNTDNLNPYGYGYNNPVSFDDPDGRCPACWGALIGAGVDIALQMATNAATGKDVTDIKWGQVAVSAGAGALSGGISSLSKIKSLGALAKVGVEIATDTGISVGSQAINDGKVSLTKTAIDVGAGQLVGRGVGKVVEKRVVNSAKGKHLQANINREKNVARGKSNTIPKNKADVNTAKKKLDTYVNNRSSASSTTASGAASTTVEKIDEKRKNK
jgi:RHS repeat-associated protein